VQFFRNVGERCEMWRSGSCEVSLQRGHWVGAKNNATHKDRYKNG
jgi:hypothetical protein